MDRLDKQMKFILEVDKLKNVYRQTYISDASRKENDSEHSWHLAIMCLLLKEYANESIDLIKVITMVLIHDIVEIDAGDTYAYDFEAAETKKEKEFKAAERIFNILPKDQADDFRKIWDEFEEGETSEAKFANALDKVQPLMLNDSTRGISWRHHYIKKDQVLKRNKNTSDGSKQLWEYCMGLIDRNVEDGNLLTD